MGGIKLKMLCESAAVHAQASRSKELHVVEKFASLCEAPHGNAASVVSSVNDLSGTKSQY